MRFINKKSIEMKPFGVILFNMKPNGFILNKRPKNTNN
jgi:hypothetical protein